RGCCGEYARFFDPETNCWIVYSNVAIGDEVAFEQAITDIRRYLVTHSKSIGKNTSHGWSFAELEEESPQEYERAFTLQHVSVEFLHAVCNLVECEPEGKGYSQGFHRVKLSFTKFKRKTKCWTREEALWLLS